MAKVEGITSKEFLEKADKFGRRRHGFVAVPVLDGMAVKLPGPQADVALVCPSPVYPCKAQIYHLTTLQLSEENGQLL